MRRAVSLSLALLLLAPACRDRDEERSLAARATAEAEEKAQETTLTSATLEAPDAKALEDLRAEQGDYRTRVVAELDALDRVARDRRSHARRAAVEKRRDRLKQDLAAIDVATEATWPAARAAIDRDLARNPP